MFYSTVTIYRSQTYTGMKSIILLTLIINQIPVVPAVEPTTANPETCRYKNYDIHVDAFKEVMGKKCFEFLFPKFNVERSKDKCMILTKSECNYWNHCIDNAEECCRLQKESEALELKRNETNPDRNTCNHTWDGFSCWKRTPAGKSVTKKCPAYVSFPDDNDGLYVTNHCRGNGTWNTHPQTNEQWTDYSPCFLGKFKEAKTIHLVSIYVNAASVLMLGPSIGIFMGFKFLRREMTIRIHTSFFASLFFASLMRVFFTSLVVYQYLIKSGSRLLMEENKIECLALYLIHRYFQCTTYFWMFCEAFHLHQLMVNSFRPPRRTYVYHAFAWSFPFFILMIYAILRGKFMEREDDTDKQYSLISDCWIKNAGNIEWVVYVPLLICIFLNVVFLCHIIRRLLGLQTQPNEPNSFRRSVKAIFLLFPLFGIQLLAITNRVPLTSVNYFWFNIVSEIVIGSKGIIVATLFCYMNGEVSCPIILNALPKPISTKNIVYCCLFYMWVHSMRKSQSYVAEKKKTNQYYSPLN